MISGNQNEDVVLVVTLNPISYSFAFPPAHEEPTGKISACVLLLHPKLSNLKFLLLADNISLPMH